MREMSCDLAGLLRPYGPEAFFSDFWERRHLFVKRDRPRYYESLITAADLENIISNSDARYPAIQVAKGGNYYPPEAYTRNVKHGDASFMGVPDVNKIVGEYRRGATVALPAIHRTWKALGSLCDHLQSTLDHAAHANVYITPGNAKGFTPHYDIHEVFVLQIAGTPSKPFDLAARSGASIVSRCELRAILQLPRRPLKIHFGRYGVRRRGSTRPAVPPFPGS
jgi:ribosomal protein L16 Arg81 hydroxylase